MTLVDQNNVIIYLFLLHFIKQYDLD